MQGGQIFFVLFVFVFTKYALFTCHLQGYINNAKHRCKRNKFLSANLFKKRLVKTVLTNVGQIQESQQDAVIIAVLWIYGFKTKASVHPEKQKHRNKNNLLNI